MPTTKTKREATNEELRRLREFAENLPGKLWRVKLGLGNFGVVWAALLLLFVLIWWIAAWGALKTIGYNVGWESTHALWIALIGIIITGAYSIQSTIKWLRENPDHRPAVRMDAERGEVIEEKYQFVDAIRMQEQEHGGLIYFLRTDDDRVFVFYDTESQDLGVQEGEPLDSSFVPKSELKIIRAPESGFAAITQWVGVAMAVGDPLDLWADPKDWPEHEEIVDLGWGQLEETYCKTD